MVNLVEDWKVLEDYAGDKQGYYQVLGVDGTIEIRVPTGRLGFRKQFDNNADQLLSSIVSFCKSKKYIRISETIRDELFFK